ncbi:MAG: ribosome small subunit-dependent GTPase A [Bacteroidota bacterium]
MSKKKKNKKAPRREDLIRATVIRSLGSSSRVLTETGEEFDCIIRGKFRIKGLIATNPVAVGDEVLFAKTEDEGKGIIHEILERKNYILRQAIGHKHKVHILAANIDQAILLYTLDAPRTSTGFADRFLVVAEAYHIPVQIVINKVDLIRSKEEKNLLEEITQIYRKIGYSITQLSALDAKYVTQVQSLLANKRSFIGGHSGAGKSTLINLIDPDLNIKTSEVSSYHQKGMHTTTYAEMHPLRGGGYIIDTPGIKEWGIVDFTAQELGHYFPEFLARMGDCKFSDCMHISEPACAIRKSVEKGEISASRYHNYQKMLAEIIENTAY